MVKNVERFNNLTTGTGNDSITFTGSFNETIATGEGDDTINGGRGQDNVDGGDGNDLLIRPLAKVFRDIIKAYLFLPILSRDSDRHNEIVLPA